MYFDILNRLGMT